MKKRGRIMSVRLGSLRNVKNAKKLKLTNFVFFIISGEFLLLFFSRSRLSNSKKDKLVSGTGHKHRGIDTTRRPSEPNGIGINPQGAHYSIE